MITKIFYKKRILPEYVTFFVTNRCNCRCKHCFFWKELNKTKDELTLEEIRRISKSMGRFSVLSLTGGEPFLRKDLFEIIKAFYANNKIKHLVLPTNGTIDARGLAEKVLKECPKLKVRIFVSMDDIGEKHDKIRNLKGVFSNAITNFKRLKEGEEAPESCVPRP